MRLFIREHIPLVLFVMLQLAVVTVVFYLDGYRSWKVAVYAALLGLCFFGVYLVYRYATHRSFYRMLSRQDQPIEEMTDVAGSAPLPSAMRERLAEQYKSYDQLRLDAERNRENHVTFINHWVHQMKTPLSVMELMLQEDDSERSASMREETDRLRKGLEMVLYMSRLETFEQDFTVERIGLRELANEVILHNRRLFIRSGVFPKLEVEEELTVYADRKWLFFMVEQLLSNAVKYSAPGGASVIIAVYRDDRGTVLEVQDQGIGIPQSDLKRIFHPYFTGENGRRFKESTGMGLYLVQSVMDRMGYLVEAESKIGAGTVIRLVFP
ncbi:sensor histidine kinase [Paenibacillus sp. 1011MAR3C5]|uniref:sensor histidine kinase n=1 Tax=Paenibacillus sp. 1011MAR3C5 TaxID=1675787 RepID=UPI000E6C015F|nr:sensor histidine kinase [Paenibacillus sp. 1011MAR3C5]RJE91296.1 sensor histidine kinase [Paenibacillus sp. 1011MAR3C5]